MPSSCGKFSGWLRHATYGLTLRQPGALPRVFRDIATSLVVMLLNTPAPSTAGRRHHASPAMPLVMTGARRSGIVSKICPDKPICLQEYCKNPCFPWVFRHEDRQHRRLQMMCGQNSHGQIESGRGHSEMRACKIEAGVSDYAGSVHSRSYKAAEAGLFPGLRLPSPGADSPSAICGRSSAAQTVRRGLEPAPPLFQAFTTRLTPFDVLPPRRRRQCRARRDRQCERYRGRGVCERPRHYARRVPARN